MVLFLEVKENPARIPVRHLAANRAVHLISRDTISSGVMLLLSACFPLTTRVYALPSGASKRCSTASSPCPFPSSSCSIPQSCGFSRPDMASHALTGAAKHDLIVTGLSVERLAGFLRP
eukprot:345119-Hanusia_phi.AAC.2